jgi:uncharacterized protein (DUF433 family)
MPFVPDTFSSYAIAKAALLWHPRNMNAKLPIEVDPEIMSGTPVFRGTRVPVETLFNYLLDGVSLGEFLDCFPTVRRADAVELLEHFKQEALSEVTT